MKLLKAILLDLIGIIPAFIPFLGEWIDIIWAPLSAYIFLKMYGEKIGKYGSIIQFVEELIPFADFCPTFTIAYIIEKFKQNKK